MRFGIEGSVLKGAYLRAGIYVYVRDLLAGLYRIANRESVTLFLPNYPNPVDPALFAELQTSFQNWNLKLWSPPRWAFNLRKRFSPYSRMDVFHFPVSRFFFDFLGVVPDRANVFTIADLTMFYFPHHHTAENVSGGIRYCEDAVKHGDMIVVYSEHTKQDVACTLGVPKERIWVTPLAAGKEFRPIPDREWLHHQLATFGLQDQKYILSVGTLEPRKNHVRLIQAFARVVERDPNLPHKLVLAGSRGWLYEEIFEKVKMTGLEDRVVFLGRSDPLEVLYNCADLMIYPSLYEGFGLPPLEAMACGTPVIASNRSSLPEVVGDAALTFDPADEEALAQAMIQVLQDQKLKQELSNKGIQRAQLFSWERTATETLEAYKAAYRMKT